MELTISQPYFARPYSRLAASYDAALGIANFVGTRAAFEALVKRYGIKFHSAADIGCGTGLFARYLNQFWGVPVFAVDHSPEMLRIAIRNCRYSSVCLLKQDIRCLRLPCQVDLITANFDTLNHLLNPSDVVLVFRRISENLRQGGHLLFDLITPCRPLGGAVRQVRTLASRNSGVQQRIVWEPRQRTLAITVTLRSPRCFRAMTEFHRERAYSPSDVGRWLLDSGFIVRGVHDGTTLRLANDCPPRIVLVAKKL
jgi:SAM-dependent methyltransferase